MAFLDDFAALPVWLRGFARLRPATLQPPPTRLEHLQRPEVQVAVAARPGKSTGNPWLLTMNLGLPVHFPFNQSIKLFSLFFGGSFFVGDSSGWHGLAVVVL